MCGISGIVGRQWEPRQLDAMVASLRHRGPDAEAVYVDPAGTAGLGHNRLSIIDLSPAGNQPMTDAARGRTIVFNGEVYNYLELRSELAGYPFRTKTDTEVLLAAYARWGSGCLDHLVGMFAFALWDEREQTLFAARDRFGVKPLYYASTAQGSLYFASEIKALHAAGIPKQPDEVAWATYLTSGLLDYSDRTFWRNIFSLPAGHTLTVQEGKASVKKWYDLASSVGDGLDSRPVPIVQEEYISLLKESVRLRFRSDVPVAINLSGGLDSSTLLGLVQSVQGDESDVKAFTFVTGDDQYDETPWVEQMLRKTRHPSIVVSISPADVPDLARAVMKSEDEPFGGLPTLAYAKLFERARSEGIVVLLDGQGMDEQWAGYDYYRPALNGADGLYVQGTAESPTRRECLQPEFAARALRIEHPHRFGNRLQQLQYRDACYTKIPRALRFNDRISMRSSTELREPFLDHRLFELALRQPATSKIVNGTQKWMLRQIAGILLPQGVVEAPKRPVQTPQREWLRGPLRGWADSLIQSGLDGWGGAWLSRKSVTAMWEEYCKGSGNNSYFIWQWLTLGLLSHHEQ